MNLSSTINNEDRTLDIYNDSEKIVSFNYADDYIEYNNCNADISQETVEKNLSDSLYLVGIFNSILKLSGYEYKMLNDDDEIDYSDTYDNYGIQVEREKLENEYTISDGTIVSGYYIRYYKISLDTEKMSQLVEKYTVSNCVSGTGRSYYNISFEVNGGESIDDSIVCATCGDALSYKFPVAQREGYEFEGWYLEKELTNKIESLDSINFENIFDSIGCDTGKMKATLYAKWKKVEKVSVSDTGAYLKT